jgi:glycosyltransferase involved in cell wall biosynthesis
MKVLVRGPVLSKSGYGEHARQVFLWALSRGHDVRCQILNWGMTPWFLDKNDLNGIVGEIMNRSSAFEDKADLSLQIQLPNEWDVSLANVNIGITAGVETDRCSRKWKDACNTMHHVIVPSDFARQSLVSNGGVNTQVSVIPEAYNNSIDAPITPLMLEEIDTTYNFLLFGQVTGNDLDSDRKNLFYSVKWFCEEFAGNKDVGLIIKSNLGTNSVFHKKSLHNLFKKLISEVRKSEYPKVYLLNGDMTSLEVAGLLKSKKVNSMISLTRGEGYGLPLIDAAASDLPIIATNWSGHLEFLNRGHFTKVEYDLVEIPKQKIDENIFVEGARWAMPREVDAKKRMRKSYESQTKPQEWARDLGKTIRLEYSHDAIFKKYDELFGKIL